MNRFIVLGLATLWVSGATRAHAADGGGARSVVFTTSNEAAGNRVLAFAADRHGDLAEPVAFATQGLGTGDSLGSQSALTLSENRRFLLVVNAGSNDITSFAVEGSSLSFRDKISSGGTRPISITERAGLVYVVNAGGVNNVAGFSIDNRGRLCAIAGATRPLSTASAGPGQIELTDDARLLIVSEKTTSKLTVYRVSAYGRLDAGRFEPSAGTTPFGFEFAPSGDLIVSEAATNSLSSYDVMRDGNLSVVSAAIPDTQKAPCWVAISADGEYAFTANAGSSSISSYGIGRKGKLTLLNAQAAELGPKGAPLDLAFGTHGRVLYVLDRGDTEISGFALNADGSLSPLSASVALPAFSTGLAAF